MNRRTLKKRCKRAMTVLISEHGFKPDLFQPSDGSETIYSPVNLERRFNRSGFIEPGPLKGTPLLWLQASYEYDEWDAHLPSEYLDDLIFWQNFVPADEDISAYAAWAESQNIAIRALKPGT